MLSFLDAFFGYHHIPMYPPNVEKMTFITPHGLYCFNVMPFDLKNVGATYQRLVTKIFRPLIGRTMEVYINDMLVNTKERPNHTKHLQETFELLRTNGMKLNPLKCALEISSGKFLSFMMTRRGIEANPTQLRAIMESQPPATRKGVQQLIGRLSALGRFISHFTDRLKSFFTTLKGAKRAGWDTKCDQALTTVKQYLTEPPILASPETGETLYLYIVISDVSVSAALFKEKEHRQ